MDISIGSRVRSFDFDSCRDLEGDSACFVEGVLKGTETVEGSLRYRILVERDIFGGVEEDGPLRHFVYPPVNGTLTFRGRLTSFVEVL